MSEYSSSSSDSWTLRDLGNALDKTSNQGRWFIRLPKFQRSLVWNESQKAQLIDSLYRGFPIGTLLTYQTTEKSGNRFILEAVDGLQRMSTIDEYVKTPLAYAPVELLFDSEFIFKVANALNLDTNDEGIIETTNRIESWLHSTKILKPNAGWNFEKFREVLSKDNQELHSKLGDISEDFHDAQTKAQEIIAQVNSSKVPVITYTGPISNIPTIFERINNQGTQLSKYEIFASTWLNARTYIASNEVCKAIKEKYDVLIDAGYEISGYDTNVDIAADEYNLYEYLFGLGKVLASKYPMLFSNPKSPDEVNPIAFVIFSTILKLKISDMDKLASKMPRNDQGIIDPTAIEQAIFRACEIVSDALSPFLKLKLNRTASTLFIPHSQNQILSLIIEHLLNSHDLLSWAPLESSIANHIKQNIAAHYIYDIIRNSWRGSGDSRLSSLSWEEDGSPAKYYASPVSRQNMSEAIRTWHDELLTGKQKERARIAPTVKAVLLFIYANIVTVYENAAVVFEIEHIYPVGYLAERISTLEDDGWPISALGNLMILPKTTNRIKGKNLLGDFLPELIENKSIQADEIESIQTYLMEPNWDQITNQNNLIKSDYVEFCNKRVGAMINQIASVLNLS